MPISDYPFTCIVSGSIARPMLPICIINPHTGKSLCTWALIDTGADECALPAVYAGQLGHDLQAGAQKQIGTGNGVTNAYAHTTRIDIFCINGNGEVGQTYVHSIPDTPIDFMPNLSTVLLGVRNFLSGFTLNINYPQQSFSLRK